MSHLPVHLRNHLISQGIVRHPRVAGAAPPLWLDPVQGAPAPGEGDNATEIGPDVVLGAFTVTGVPPVPFQGFIRQDAIEFRLRTKTAPLARTIEAQIRAELNDRRDWLMDSLRINQSMVFRELSLIGSSKAEGFTYSFEYLFDVWS